MSDNDVIQFPLEGMDFIDVTSLQDLSFSDESSKLIGVNGITGDLGSISVPSLISSGINDGTRIVIYRDTDGKYIINSMHDDNALKKLKNALSSVFATPSQTCSTCDAQCIAACEFNCSLSATK